MGGAWHWDSPEWLPVPNQPTVCVGGGGGGDKVCQSSNEYMISPLGQIHVVYHQIIATWDVRILRTCKWNLILETRRIASLSHVHTIMRAKK